jgi:hypothetical protein
MSAGTTQENDRDRKLESVLDAQAGDFYRDAMTTLSNGGIEFLVGGAFAFARYTDIYRMTKDFDVFIRKRDRDTALRVLADGGFRVDLTFPHWLGKAFKGDDFVDLIYASGNGTAPVDDRWFEHAVSEELLGIPIKLVPAEEMIWQKAFVMERERYDGADIMHLIHSRAEQLDWSRLLERFGDKWRVLFINIVLFGFVYPGERTRIPREIVEDLSSRLLGELEPWTESVRLTQGTLISRGQYLHDVGSWGYEDARLEPRGNMSAKDIAHWTAAIDEKK